MPAVFPAALLPSSLAAANNNLSNASAASNFMQTIYTLPTDHTPPALRYFISVCLLLLLSGTLYGLQKTKIKRFCARLNLFGNWPQGYHAALHAKAKAKVQRLQAAHLTPERMPLLASSKPRWPTYQALSLSQQGSATATPESSPLPELRLMRASNDNLAKRARR